jgi:hypothetical protein
MIKFINETMEIFMLGHEHEEVKLDQRERMWMESACRKARRMFLVEAENDEEEK